MTEVNEMDTTQLIVDTANKIFHDAVDKKLLDEAERGNFAQDLWKLIVANGFHLLGTKDSGTSVADMYAFLQVCGQHAVPLPLAESLTANLWLHPSDQISSIGWMQSSNSAYVTDAVWGNQADRVLGICVPENANLSAPQQVFVLDQVDVQTQEANMAGEPLARVKTHDGAITAVDVTVSPVAQMALARVNLMAGCLQTVLDLGIQFASERSQFGRPIAKFQAIQHSLAVIAAEVAAARRAADAAVDALEDARFVFEVAGSKARVGEAVGLVAEQVHQIHGAMGFTHEHRLHHFTRRLWSWRDSFGNEFFWQTLLGRHLAELGADQAWDFIATRS